MKCSHSPEVPFEEDVVGPTNFTRLRDRIIGAEARSAYVDRRARRASETSTSERGAALDVEMSEAGFGGG
jgi:hypothetical protein